MLTDEVRHNAGCGPYLADVHEYLIRAEDGDFLLPHVTELGTTLHPAGRDCEVLDGAGDYCMRCAGMVATFSFEEPGIHVIVESGDADSAGQLVDEIAAQVAASMSRATVVMAL
jgi:hypothetical protein